MNPQQGEEAQPVDHAEQDNRSHRAEQSLENDNSQSLSHDSTGSRNQVALLPRREKAILNCQQACSTDQADGKTNPRPQTEEGPQKKPPHSQPEQTQGQHVGGNSKELNLDEPDEGSHRADPVLARLIGFHVQGKATQEGPIRERKLDWQVPRGIGDER